MAKDERLYARFDIAMDEHPKIMLLSDAAFRTLFEATFYSRRQLTDGFLAEGIVDRRWKPEAIAELRANDPEKPSLFPVEKSGVPGLMIHDYEKHQTTTADIEAKKAAGRKGGMAKAKNAASKPVAPASEVLGQKASTTPTPPLAITETETEKETSTKDSSSELRPDVERLCILLRDLVIANGSKPPIIGPGWHTAARLMLVADGRDPEAAERLMRWCQADPFWKANVLSMPKFRKGYDQIRLQAERQRIERQQQGGGRRPKAEQIDDVRALGRRMQADEDRKAISA